MSGPRVSSSPDLLPMSTSRNSDDSSLEGIAANMKLLLKLIQDHQEASKGAIDERRVQRLAGIMTIIDDVKTRLQKSQTQGVKKELRRCNTDLRVNNPPRDHHHKKNESLILDEKEKLRRDLHTSYAAQKRLGVMCASLGREKEIIARELTRKVQELNEIEELVSDLKAQNERLSNKVQACVAEHNREDENEKNCDKGSEMGQLSHNAILEERNQELSDQLVRLIEGYKSMKRRLKEGKDELEGMQGLVEEVGEEVEVGIHQIQRFKQRVCDCGLGEQLGEIEEKIAALERVFRRLEAKVSRYRKEGRQ